jgi:hypothetical protein
MTLDEVLLFQEDFADLPIGAASTFPPTADGEYHVVNRRMGRWTEATFHHSWRNARIANWLVVHEQGRHVMGATQQTPHGPPMLATGDRFWGDYRLEADLRPLSFEGACGLVVRYQDCRRYIAVRITRGQIALIHCDHGKQRYLASRGHVFGVDRYYRLRVECVGPQIAVYVEGDLLLQANETEFLQGKVGIWATAPARFGNIRMTTSGEAQAAAEQRAAAWQRQEEQLRQSLPKPKVWKTITTTGFGTDRNLRFGDLNGDGRPEIVLAQRIELGNGNFPEINCLTAIDLDGNVLWQFGEPSPTFEAATADLCFQVYDLDGDGCAEVLFCKDFRIWRLDGRTGNVLSSEPTPISRAARHEVGWPYERILGDSLHICNLSGSAYPQEILIKDRYNNLWALDRNLRELWHSAAVTGHFPITYDVDGDGRDEVINGYTLLDHDGSLLWELPFDDHQDAIGIGPFDPERPDQLLIAMSIGDEGFLLVTAEGEVLAQHKIGHVQNLCIANLRPESPGMDYLTINYWGHPGIMAVFNCRGDMIDTFELLPHSSAITPVNWTGTGQEFAFLSPHPTEGGLIDGYGRRVVMFPDDGHPAYCYTSLDLDGDGRDELVTWDTEAIWIYQADAPLPPGRRYRPIRMPLYNESNYMARVSLPRWEE